MRSVRALLSAAVTFALAGTALAAQDATLYDPAPPPGAGFVRMVNLLDHPDELPTRLGTKDLGPVAHRAVSPYVPVMGGAGKVTLASGEEQPIAVEAGGYYTVVGKGTAGQPAITVISVISSRSITRRFGCPSSFDCRAGRSPGSRQSPRRTRRCLRRHYTRRLQCRSGH